MTLKDEILIDIDDVFLDFDDFAEEHMFDDTLITCMFDDDKLTARQGSNDLAISESTRLLFAKSSDLPKKMKSGTKIKFDHQTYVIDDWKENMGMAEIAMHHGEG